jgi:hypothetical protein
MNTPPSSSIPKPVGGPIIMAINTWISGEIFPQASKFFVFVPDVISGIGDYAAGD